MKEYKIPVSWTVAVDMTIQADSFEEALQKAEESSLPEGAHYVDDSFEIDMQSARALNSEDGKGE